MSSTAQFVSFGPFFSAGALVTAPKLYHYIVGTTTDMDVWTNRTKMTTAAQPVVGDANGVVSCFADGLYKFVVKDSADNTLYTWDNYEVMVDTSESLHFYVEDYGAVGDGVTNDATAIQAAITAAGAAGGGTVVFGPDVYAIGSTITNTYDNVLLQGQGAGYTSSRGPGNDYLTASTALLWIGSAGGTMVDIGPVVSATYSLFGGGVVGIFLEGDELAATGLKLRSVNNGIYDIVVEECTTVAVDIGVESTIAGGPGTQSNWFRRIVTIQQQTTSGIGVRLDGAGTFNVSLNVFGILTLLHRDALALDLGDTDGNTFNFVRVFRHGSGTSVAIRLRAGTSPDYARANQFFFVQAAAGGLVAEGLASGTSPSSSNIIHTYSLDNGSPLPVVEWGASLSYDTSRGLKRESRTDSWSVFQMHRASQTNGNNLGRVEFLGYDDAATPAEITYGYVNGIIRTATAGATDGTVRIAVQNAGVDTMQALFGDGVLIGASPTGSFLGVGTLNAVADLYKNGSNLTAREVVTYSTSMTPNQRNGCAHTITATNGTAFTINNPTNSIDGDIVTIMIRNTSGGALGVATFGAGYKLGAAWTQPATGFSRSIQFLNDGTNWVEINRTAADVSN